LLPVRSSRPSEELGSAPAGGVIGGVGQIGISEEEAARYAESLRGGRVLVIVHADQRIASEARAILSQHGANEPGEAYQQDYVARYSGSGRSYEAYAPAYRMGAWYAGQPQFSMRDWESVEPEIRRDWDLRSQGPWDEFKEAVRHGWNTVRTGRP